MKNRFRDEEVEIYQQGKNLIIRLKKIHFKSGSAKIPNNSVGLLLRISSVISKMHPSEIIIEGHTDSVGTPHSNYKLSKKRAAVIMNYLSNLNRKYFIDSRGLGESKPIASNQTHKGRSLNRRVDIVLKGIKK